MSAQMLPRDPSLDHLKQQAKDLLKGWQKADPASLALLQEFHPRSKNGAIKAEEAQLSDAQLVIARKYSFLSWPRLKAFVDSYQSKKISEDALRLKAALDANDIPAINQLLDQNPELINEHLERGKGYQNRRPLTYVCQRGKVELARLLLERGANIAEDGNLPIARACLRDTNLPVVQLLVERGVDVNTLVYSWGPLILYPAECLAPGVMKFLLEKGADPNKVIPGADCQDTALQMVLGTYGRSEKQAQCLEVLIEHGVKFEDGPVMDILRNRLDSLRDRIQAKPALITQHFSNVNFGSTAARSMTAKGGTLLHVAAEWNHLEAARMLLDAGANVNATANTDEYGIGGQTPLFHAVSQYDAIGLPLVKLLAERGADLKVRAKVPGDYDKPGQTFTGTALGYATRYPEFTKATDQSVLQFLRSKGAVEEAHWHTPNPKEEFIQAVNGNDLSLLRDQLKRSEIRKLINEPFFPLDQPAIVLVRRDRGKVDLLLNAGADINARSIFWGRTVGVLDDNKQEMIEYLKSRGAIAEATPFVEAVNSGNVEKVRALLEQSPALREKIDARWFPFGSTALISSRENREMLDLLLDHGADPNVRSDWSPGGYHVLDGASEPIAEHLIKRGATLDIHAACELGKFDAVKKMLDEHPEWVNKKGGDGKHPLHTASTPQLVAYLLDHGAEIDARCEDHHSTALQYGVQQEWKVNLLLERGATPDIFALTRWNQIEDLKKLLERDPAALRACIGKDGYPLVPPGTIYQWQIGFDLTPLQVAEKFGHKAALELLLSQCDITQRFMHACMTAIETTARKLLQEKPDLVSTLSKEDTQQIAIAAWSNNFEAVKLMVELGFPINWQFAGRSTPLDSAACRGFVKIVEFLITRGADLTVLNQYGGWPLTTCMWGSLNFKDPRGDYPATARALLKAGSQLPRNPVASEDVLEVLK